MGGLRLGRSKLKRIEIKIKIEEIEGRWWTFD